MLVKTKVEAPCVEVTKIVEAGIVVSIVIDRVIVEASAVVVSLGNVLVKITVLPSLVVVRITVDA